MNVSGHRIKAWKFDSTQRLFFDTNIWLFIYGAYNAPDDSRIKTYSNALRRARDAQATIYTGSIVMGEFINRSLRDDYAFHHPPSAGRTQYKSYRNSAEYAASARAVAINARAILNDCQRIEGAFASCDIEAELSRLESGQTDWSDQMIVALCRDRELILVTDDGDFGDSGLTILTRNPVYFPRATGNETV